MSILKAQKELDDLKHHHKIGFSRKSVSFCQRDNVHVYENEDEISDADSAAIDLTIAPGDFSQFLWKSLACDRDATFISGITRQSRISRHKYFV